jgi:hypothetical protein
MIPTPNTPRPQVQRITEQVLLAGGQLLLAGGVAILYEYIANAMGLGESGQSPLAPAGPQILDASIIAMLGFLFAWLVVRLLPSAANTGRWVWLPPAALLALLVGWDVLQYGRDWHLISAFYFWHYAGQKFGPIGRDFITYPTLSATAYALEAQLCILRRRKGAQG